MRRSRLFLGVVAVLAVLAAVAGCSADAATMTATRLDRPYTVPDVSLTDTDGQPFSLATSTNDPLTIVYFGYTRCDDICPMVLTNLASAMTRLDDSDRSRTQVVFVTSDPSYDTAPVIRRYLDRFDPSFIGLTGTFDAIDSVARPLAVGLDKINAGGHTTSALALSSDDKAIAYWDDNTSPSQFASDIHTLLQDAS